MFNIKKKKNKFFVQIKIINKIYIWIDGVKKKNNKENGVKWMKC